MSDDREIQPGDWVEQSTPLPHEGHIDLGCWVVGRTQGGQWVLEDLDQQLLRYSDSDFRKNWKLSQ